MIYSAQTELAFENALQQLMNSFNVDGEYIVDHLEARGVSVNVVAYDRIHILEDELEDTNNELQQCEDAREQLERNEDYLISSLRTIKEIIEQDGEEVSDGQCIDEIVTTLEEIEDVL